jgi:hypothetical protein
MTAMRPIAMARSQRPRRWAKLAIASSRIARPHHAPAIDLPEPIEQVSDGDHQTINELRKSSLQRVSDGTPGNDLRCGRPSINAAKGATMRRLLSNPARRHRPRLARIGPAVLALTALPIGAAAAQARFAETEVFFELNSTDRDVGLHAFFDAEAWKDVRIEGPEGRRVFQVQARGPSRQIGVTELRFEGEEPNVLEVPFSRLRTLFPPGRYRFSGTTVDDRALAGRDELTAELPCPTRITAPTDGSTVTLENLIVRWTAPAGVFNPDSQRCDRRRDVGLVGFQVTVDHGNSSTRRSPARRPAGPGAATSPCRRRVRHRVLPRGAGDRGQRE